MVEVTEAAAVEAIAVAVEEVTAGVLVGEAMEGAMVEEATEAPVEAGVVAVATTPEPTPGEERLVAPRKAKKNKET